MHAHMPPSHPPLYRRLDTPHGQSEQVQKISPPPGFDPRTAQPIAGHYTDYATCPTHPPTYSTFQYFAHVRCCHDSVYFCLLLDRIAVTPCTQNCHPLESYTSSVLCVWIVTHVSSKYIWQY